MNGNLDRASRAMMRMVATLALLIAGLGSAVAHADPADINAASRGVVRIIIVGQEDGKLYPLSHGTGFAVTPESIVTNAHVIEEMRRDPTLSIVIVPPEGGSTVYGKLASVSDRNDLALVHTTSPMNLPPLTISGNSDTESGEVTSVGYPMNVDRAQGLEAGDIFKAQPPVKSTGFLSGRRPSRDFDTILHTAPIARGNSGGPLLDSCGRVVGVNSFGADSEGADAEFYFAVSTRELLPFLRGNNITPQVNGLPCRSMADLDAAERERADRALLVAKQEQADRSAQQIAQAEKARRTAELQVLSQRDNGMMLAMVLIATGLVGAFIAWQMRGEDNRTRRIAASGVAGLSLLGAVVVWLNRPGFDEIDEIAASLVGSGKADGAQGPNAGQSKGEGALVCVIDLDRSRITTGETSDVPLDWQADGCVNDRTQYGQVDGKWQRVLVPNTESVVSVASYSPEKREYRVDRYFLGRKEMEAARAVRAQFEAPQCGAADADNQLGVMQSQLISLLPSAPNERLVYECSTAPGGQ